jgi:hypothetical protein
MASTGSGKSRTIRNLVILVGIIVAGLVIEWGIRMIDAPWSLGGEGATPLGDWYAPVTLDEGATGWLVMSLDFFDTEDHPTGQNLEGMGRSCVGSVVEELGVSGALARDGRVEAFGFAQSLEDPVWITYIDGGQWDGNSQRLTLIGRYSYDPTGRHISVSGTPEPTMELVFVPARAEQMTAVCR